MTNTLVSSTSKTGAIGQESQRRAAKISLHAAMNRFYDRDDQKLVVGTRKDYEHALMMLEMYVNEYGAVLLRAADAKPTFGKSKGSSVSKSYDPASLARFFRGFVLFFLPFKVKAADETKDTFVRIIEEFALWLLQKRLLPEDFDSDFTTVDWQSIKKALQATTVLSNALSHAKTSRRDIEDIHDGEPLYMVSRVKSGKLWFVYYTNEGYDEFGPVRVPLGVTDNVSAGWLIECEFAKYGGRWQITASKGVMPV